MIYTRGTLNKYEWHDWFAWYPVTVDVWIVHGSCKTLYVHKRVWLKTIRRKKVQHYADDETIYSLKN